MGLEDKVALVTGAAGSGMGRSIALTLAREGARVAVNYRTNSPSAEGIVHHIVDRGGNAISVRGDVMEAQQCETMVRDVVERLGPVDICVVNPGAGWHPEGIDRLQSSSALDDVRREVAPVFHMMPLLLPDMFKRGWGRFIAIALHPTRLPPAYSYNVAKAARTHALLLAQDEAWKHGVTMNILAPGPVEAFVSVDDAVDQCDHGPSWRSRTTASPQDIAEGVAFLCSDAGRFITGCILPYGFRG